MRIALAQIVASTEPRANLDLVGEYTARAREAGADLVVFPEATMASFATRSAAVAQPVDGEWATGVRDAAREHGIAVVAGMFTPGADGKARNTVLVIDATGDLLATYDKIHLFDAWGFEESRHMEAGDTPVIVEVGGLSIGLATCYDVRFPELFKHLAHAGAEVILVPASWANGPGKAEQWRALCVARALDSTCFILAAGQADPTTVGHEVKKGSPTGIGHSLAVSPLGEVLAEAGAASELLVVDVDAEALTQAREKLPVLATSRLSISAP
ncbi:MAG: carbon-nitrogen hydrolase family protein [Propionibacteriaceae bacterium]|nr:carbon-nitrogen hydrolase family protein [Propionibacteriaceae bacterium]